MKFSLKSFKLFKVLGAYVENLYSPIQYSTHVPQLCTEPANLSNLSNIAILRKTAASAVRNVRELLRSLPLTLNLLFKGQNI